MFSKNKNPLSPYRGDSDPESLYESDIDDAVRSVSASSSDPFVLESPKVSSVDPTQSDYSGRATRPYSFEYWKLQYVHVLNLYLDAGCEVDIRAADRDEKIAERKAARSSLCFLSRLMCFIGATVEPELEPTAQSDIDKYKNRLERLVTALKGSDKKYFKETKELNPTSIAHVFAYMLGSFEMGGPELKRLMAPLIVNFVNIYTPKSRQYAEGEQSFSSANTILKLMTLNEDYPISSIESLRQEMIDKPDAFFTQSGKGMFGSDTFLEGYNHAHTQAFGGIYEFSTCD